MVPKRFVEKLGRPKKFGVKPENFPKYITNNKYLKYPQPVYSDLPYPKFPELYNPEYERTMVTVRCNVDSCGNIVDHSILNPILNCPECMSKVQEIIENAHFIPAYQNGVRVSGVGTIMVYFRE